MDRTPPRGVRHPIVCTAIGMVGNVVLTVGKLVIGVAAGSAALVADGLHSFSDLAGDVGVLIALRASAAPPDEHHPYGHHNFETLGAMAASLVLLGTGVLMGREAVLRLFHGATTEPSLTALSAAVVSILAKEAMARYTAWVGLLNNSPALRTNAAHHRSDALSSLAATAGILGTVAGYPAADSAAALLISFWIVRMGWLLLRENTDILMEARPDAKLHDAVSRSALSVPGVDAVRRVRIRPRGSIYIVDIDVAVPDTLTVGQGHSLAHDVEERIRRDVPGVIGASVHVEPLGSDLNDASADAPGE